MPRIHPLLPLLVVALSGGACVFDDDAVKFRVTMENISRDGQLTTDRFDGSLPLSPGAFAVFKDEDDDFVPIFREGRWASPGLERLAEDGVPSRELADDDDRDEDYLLDELDGEPYVLEFGTFRSPGGDDEGPLLTSGEGTSFEFFARPGDELQVVSGFIQANDWFIGIQDEGFPLFNAFNEARTQDITDEFVLYDAGTEKDAAPGTGDNQGTVQEGPDEGETENSPVLAVYERGFDYYIPPEEFVRVTLVAFD